MRIYHALHCAYTHSRPNAYFLEKAKGAGNDMRRFRSPRSFDTAHKIHQQPEHTYAPLVPPAPMLQGCLHVHLPRITLRRYPFAPKRVQAAQSK